MSLAPYRLEHRWKELLAAQFWSNLITKKVSAAGSVPDAVLKKAGLPKRPRAARREKIRISAHFKQSDPPRHVDLRNLRWSLRQEKINRNELATARGALDFKMSRVAWQKREFSGLLKDSLFALGSWRNFLSRCFFVWRPAASSAREVLTPGHPRRQLEKRMTLIFSWPKALKLLQKSVGRGG